MRALLTAALLVLIAMPTRAEVIDIDNAELDRLLKSGTKLIDIRTRPEWEDTGIITGSHLLTFFDERGRYDAAQWLNQVSQIAKRDEAVIVLCRTGNRTRPVSRLLSEQAGYTRVYNVRSGIKAWIANGLPLKPAQAAIVSCQAAKTC